MRLAERLAKMERATTQAEKVIVVSWVAPRQLDRELQSLRRGDQRWRREAVESEDAFIDRAKAEVERSGNGVTILFADIGPDGRPLRDGEESVGTQWASG